MSEELTAFLNFQFEIKRVTIKVAEGDTMSTAMRWQLNWRDYLARLAEFGIDGGANSRPSLMRYAQPMPESVVFEELMMFQTGLRSDLAEVIRNKRLPWSMFHRIFGETDGVMVKFQLGPEFRGEVTPNNIRDLGISVYYDASTYRVYIMSILRDLIVSKQLFNLWVDDDDQFHLAKPGLFAASPPAQALPPASPTAEPSAGLNARQPTGRQAGPEAGPQIEDQTGSQIGLKIGLQVLERIEQLSQAQASPPEADSLAPSAPKGEKPKVFQADDSVIPEALDSIAMVANIGSGAAARAKSRLTGVAPPTSKPRQKKPQSVLPGLERSEPQILENAPQSGAGAPQSFVAGSAPLKRLKAVLASLEAPEAILAANASSLAFPDSRISPEESVESLQSAEGFDDSASMETGGGTLQKSSQEASQEFAHEVSQAISPERDLGPRVIEEDQIPSSAFADEADAFAGTEIAARQEIAQGDIARNLNAGDRIGREEAPIGPGAIGQSSEERVLKAESIVESMIQATEESPSGEDRKMVATRAQAVEDIIEAMDQAARLSPLVLSADPATAKLFKEFAGDMARSSREQAQDDDEDFLEPAYCAGQSALSQSGSERAMPEREISKQAAFEQASASRAISGQPVSSRRPSRVSSPMAPSSMASNLAAGSLVTGMRETGPSETGPSETSLRETGSPEAISPETGSPAPQVLGADLDASPAYAGDALPGLGTFGDDDDFIEPFFHAPEGLGLDEPASVLSDDDDIYEAVSPVAEEEDDPLDHLGANEEIIEPATLEAEFEGESGSDYEEEIIEPVAAPAAEAVPAFEAEVVSDAVQAPEAEFVSDAASAPEAEFASDAAPAPEAEPVPAYATETAAKAELSPNLISAFAAEIAAQTELESQAELASQTELASQAELASQSERASQTELAAQAGLASQTELAAQAEHAFQTGPVSDSLEEEPLSLSAVAEEIIEPEEMEDQAAPVSASEFIVAKFGLEIGGDDTLPDDLVDGTVSHADLNLETEEAEEPLELLELADEAEDSEGEEAAGCGAEEMAPKRLLEAGLNEESLLGESLLEEGFIKEALAANVAGALAEEVLEEDEEFYEEDDFDDSEIDFLPVEFKVATLEQRLALKLKERSSGLASFQVDIFKAAPERKLNGL